MAFVAKIAIFLVAALHFGFLALEMFLWDKPAGMRVFRTDPDFAGKSKVLAANQGLYNGFLALGLLWSLWPIGISGAERSLATFFLLCVIAAGTYGAATVSRRILWVQAAPAALALALLWVLPA